MMTKINKTAMKGQTALILILLTAAALIFLAITLNWGRVAQVKSLLTVAADEGAASLASAAASYGEMEKQSNLKNTNQKSGPNGVILAIVVLVAAVITILDYGSTATLFTSLVLYASVAFAVANLVLQLTVVQPTISTVWNKLQKDQPIQQQFYEQGIVTALQGAVGDQVNITDYFDLNTNGAFGNAPGSTNDLIGRFAFFYTDRLKMLNQPPIPQVVFFYNQLQELMNGETCAQNETDISTNPNIAFNPACLNLGDVQHCTVENPSDPACQIKIPNGFQLNDACVDSDPSSPTFNPYCDPCCQPATIPDPDYTDGSYPLHSAPTISVRPSYCDPSVTPPECLTNNPFNSPGQLDSAWPFLYDPAFQNYTNGISFLAQLGRDQPLGPFTSSLTPQGNASNGVFFPNGVYPFFWLMKDYSPEVDNIDPAQSLSSSQVHWCAKGGAIGSSGAAPTGFSDLAQLSLPYACQGKDCCVNYFANGVTNGIPSGINTNMVIDAVGSSSNPALDPSFGEGGTGSWLPGDNQMCSIAWWPYNGSYPMDSEGTCELGSAPASANPPVGPGGHTAIPPSVSTFPPTEDNLDDIVHTLSDFVNFSNAFISGDVGGLSSTFDTWYPEVANWIAPGQGTQSCAAAGNAICTKDTWNAGDSGSSGQDGRLLSIYNPYTGLDKLDSWAGKNGVITKWLEQNYASSPTGASPWCVPPSGDPSLNVNNKPTDESAYIAANGAANDAKISAINPNFISAWGDLGYVTACLNYNSSQNSNGTPLPLGPVHNYQQCLTALTSGTCPTSLPAQCDALILGRSLAGPNPNNFNGSCDVTQQNSYAKWVSDSLTLATAEAPKFALRAQFLNDIYTRAATMEKSFYVGDKALQSFLGPGGPADQLIQARANPQPVTTLPNAVIYGWQDNLTSGTGSCTDSQGKTVGCAHIVKVTAYSPGRAGAMSSVIASMLPWIKTSSNVTSRYYTLTDRDGYVYVSVRRWDQEHNSATFFPNGHPLWQFSFHNPKVDVSSVTQGLPPSCRGVNFGKFGFGLETQTVSGLNTVSVIPQDVTSLGNAFMLNDEGNGTAKVDPYATGSSSYGQCLSDANALLAAAPESHACAEYIAARNANKSIANGGSSTGDNDYSLIFVDCNSVGVSWLDDLTG